MIAIPARHFAASLQFEARRIGICWDGSPLAARALKDAKPFLSRTETLVTISINDIRPRHQRHCGKADIDQPTFP